MRTNHPRLLVAVILALAPAALASTTWYVNGTSGNNSNTCISSVTACKTIRHAISLASSGDSIMVAAGAYKERITIGFNLTVIGSGAGTTALDGGFAGRVVAVSSSTAHVTLSKLALLNGLVSGEVANGGGLLNSGTLTINDCIITNNQAKGHYGSLGGGIYNTGRLTINRVTISNNRTFVISGGGGIYNRGNLTVNNSALTSNSAAVGGGVFNSGGMLTINKSTFSSNSADVGGGIDNTGQLAVNNSTISGNRAEDGGGIDSPGTLTISSSTFSGNSATKGGAVFNNGGTATLQNSIVADSAAGGNCNGVIASGGYNLSSDGTCNFSNTGDQNNADPKLGPLQNNGGPTATMALSAGSPAIDAGNPSGCTDGQGHLLKTDQRGQSRPDKEDSGGCDIGAYERQSD